MLNVINKWPIPDELINSEAVAYRNAFAETLANRAVSEIVSSYVYLTIDQMQTLYNRAVRFFLSDSIKGVGIELGAGCGLLSAIVAREPTVQQVISLEVCEMMVEKVIPKVAEDVLGNDARKVIPVVGSFDDLQLGGGTVDFAFEIDSLHHSENLPRTFSEVFRVLKKKGIFFLFDRCHLNSVTDSEVEAMLSRVYSKDFLLANGYPPDVVLTRKMNGEHEYRQFEWEKAYLSAGFRLVTQKTFIQAITFKEALYGIFACLGLHRDLKKNYSLGATRGWISQYFQKYWTGTVLAPKSTTFWVLIKD